MDRIHFEVGNEKRVAEFIANLDDKDKIALLSHTDLDGVASAKIINEVIKPDKIELIDYDEMTKEFVDKLKEEKIKKVIIADLTVDDREFIIYASKFFDILWIDHHKITEDFNSDKIIFLNPGGKNKYCAAYISYYLFSKVVDLTKYDWLVACACLSDFTIYENKEWLKEIFSKYKDDSEIKPMSEENSFLNNIKRNLEFAIMNFKTKEKLNEILNLINSNPEGINELEPYANEVKKEVEFWLERFKKEKEEAGNRIIFKLEPNFNIGSIISNKLSLENPEKTIVTIRPLDKNSYAMSLRRQDGGEDMIKLVKTTLAGLENAGGGGHIPAAGGHFLKKDLETVLQRLKSF